MRPESSLPSSASDRFRAAALRSCDGTWTLAYDGAHLVLAVSGDLQQQVEQAFIDAAMRRLDRHGAGGVVIDCSACRSLSSSSIGFLVHFHHEARHRGHRVVLVQPRSTRVEELFQTLGLDRLPEIADDRSGAYARLSID